MYSFGIYFDCKDVSDVVCDYSLPSMEEAEGGTGYSYCRLGSASIPGWLASSQFVLSSGAALSAALPGVRDQRGQRFTEQAISREAIRKCAKQIKSQTRGDLA